MLTSGTSSNRQLGLSYGGLPTFGQVSPDAAVRGRQVYAVAVLQVVQGVLADEIVHVSCPYFEAVHHV